MEVTDVGLCAHKILTFLWKLMCDSLRGIHVTQKLSSFHSDIGYSSKQIFQKSCRISIAGDTRQTFDYVTSVILVLFCYFLCPGKYMDQMFLEIPLSLNYSVILKFQIHSSIS